MWVELTKQQLKLLQEAVAFATQSLRCAVVARDHGSIFDRDVWARCAEFGLLRMVVPTKYGGAGYSLTDLLAVMEGLGYGAADQGMLFALNAHLWTAIMPLITFGTVAQRGRYLPELMRGSLIGANAASEASAGSDVFAMQTRAMRDGNYYILQGTKTYITNAPVADLFIVYATVDPELGPMGVSTFLVEATTPGLHRGKQIEKMGLRTALMGEITLDDCRVPADNLLGREGRGAAVFRSAMEYERGCILATCLGVMQRQLEDCIAYARTRYQFGKPISQFQAISHRIADMKVRLDTSRALVYRVGYLKDRGRQASMEAAIAKLHLSQAYLQSSLDAIQIHGARGYLTDYEIEREARNAIGSTLYSGTSEIQRNIIATRLLQGWSSGDQATAWIKSP